MAHDISAYERVRRKLKLATRRNSQFGFRGPVISGLLFNNWKLRRSSGDTYTAMPSFRLRELALMAEKVFGDKEKAILWLEKPQEIFNGKSALQMIDEQHNDVVADALIRIDEGYW